jgi:phosphoserine phosphatase RsbU/P
MALQELTREQLLLEVANLQEQLEELQQEKSDLEILLETTTEHATEIENELQEKNEQVQAYMQALQRELQVGRQIQADFLPETLPQLPGWELAARFQPAREVAGDFYDAFVLPGNQLGLVVADVCDKGVGAALFMSLTRSLVRVLAYQAHSRLQPIGPNAEAYLVQVPGAAGQPSLLLPAYTFEILNAVKLTNDYITANHSRANMFATLFFGVLDIKTGTVSYVNGGHNPPFHLSKDGIKARLALTGPAVGMLPGISYKMSQIQLELGDVLLTYTDGVTEARAFDKTFFGENRLLELLSQYCDEGCLSASTLLANIENAVQLHVAGGEPSDDLTMLAIRSAPTF